VAAEVLAAADVDPQARGEVLDVAAFARVAEQLVLRGSLDERPARGAAPAERRTGRPGTVDA
jgi:16S rRNA (adenine1518-N6/adenine1519-N6)-dimethyltransferase